MTKERIRKELEKVRKQLANLQEKEKDLDAQRQMAEDAEAMKIIKKYKISPEKLTLLNKVSEREIMQLLEKREKESLANEEKENS
ncbi:MAG: DUF4315 family protein [Clostridium sp.]|nr:DUF4315 family protein [Lachnoclostridium sp.]MCM1253949.1 DUF4315 family protein [Clostridium sp.]